jgi:hypothetical protein
MEVITILTQLTPHMDDNIGLLTSLLMVFQERMDIYEGQVIHS